MSDRSAESIGETIAGTSILVVSCDAYSDLWPIFFGLLERYWPDCPYPIYLGSNFRTYSSARVHTICVGEDRSYSDNLRNMLAQIKSEQVIILVEDLFFSAPVDTALFNSFVREFVSSQAQCLKLICSYPLGTSSQRGSLTGPVPLDIRYRVGIGASVWKVQWLSTHLPPGRSAWELEKRNVLADQLAIEGALAISSSYRGEAPFRWRHGVVKGCWLPTTLPFLLREGFASHLRNRRLLSVRETLRVGMFRLLMRAFTTFRYSWKQPIEKS